jgi:hypothetical protein
MLSGRVVKREDKVVQHGLPQLLHAGANAFALKCDSWCQVSSLAHSSLVHARGACMARICPLHSCRACAMAACDWFTG